MDPEDVRAMLSPYYLRLRTELERFGGTVEKFIGDAVMALFGAPRAHEDDPERAVRAALAIRDGMREMNEANPGLNLNLRIGVNTGEALVVLTARPSEGEGMAAGDVVNTAARLQTNAPVNGILVGQATYRATAHAIEYRELEPIRVKGKVEPVPVWEALAARPAPSRREISRTPLVGRDAELDALRGLWAQVRADRRPALAALLGQAGIGKSRLLAELAEELRGEGAVRWGRCLPYGEGITYWPVVEILKDAAGILVSDEPSRISAKLDVLLEGLATENADELRTMATALASLIGTPTTPHGTYTAPQIVQAELHWGIRRVLELLAADRPLALVFEDLHWAEPTLLDLIQFIAKGAAAPILVLASGRPELADARPAILAPAERTRVIQLAALSAGDSEALIRGLLGERGVPAGTVERLLGTAGGNPLFLEETIRMLGEAGGLGAGAREGLPVPSSLQALIGARLDGLPSPEKRVAGQASVLGSVFWTGALVYLGDGNGQLHASLGSLEHRDLVHARETSSVAGEREWAFKHVLIRDVAYGRLPKGRRAVLHLRCADWISALAGGEAEYVEIVAYHLEQACLVAREVGRSAVPPPLARAADALARAAEKAERREGFREADRYYARALALLGDEQAERLAALRLRRGITLRSLGELREAAALLERAAEDAPALGRPDLRCAALIALANVDLKQGRAADAHRRLDEARSLAEAVGDPILQIRAAFEFAAVRAHFEGAFATAIGDLRSAARTAEDIGDRALRVEGHLRLGTLFFNEGRLAEAADELERCVALAAESGSHRDEARATSLLGLVRFYRGDRDEAERLGAEAMAWFERTGDTYFQLQNLRKMALYALARGDAALAERRLLDALPVAIETGGWLVTELYRLLAETLARQGHLEGAREMAAQARASQPAEDVYARAAVALADAAVATAGGDRDAAVERFKTALALLEEQHLEVDLGEARIAYARALRRLGDVAGTRAELGRARETFARMDAIGMLAEIDRELAEMAEGTGAAGPLKTV